MAYDLATVIKAIESGNNPHAVRFEPAAYQDWDWVPAMDRIQLKHKCSKDTAKMLACTSFGLYQLMGVNIFDPRYPKDPETPLDPPDVFAFVADVGMQDVLFEAFLRAKSINYTLNDLLSDDVKMAAFVRAYNGPGNVVTYSALIREHAAET